MISTPEYHLIDLILKLGVRCKILVFETCLSFEFETEFSHLISSNQGNPWASTLGLLFCTWSEHNRNISNPVEHIQSSPKVLGALLTLANPGIDEGICRNRVPKQIALVVGLFAAGSYSISSLCCGGDLLQDRLWNGQLDCYRRIRHPGLQFQGLAPKLASPHLTAWLSFCILVEFIQS